MSKAAEEIQRALDAYRVSEGTDRESWAYGNLLAAVEEVKSSSRNRTAPTSVEGKE